MRAPYVIDAHAGDLEAALPAALVAHGVAVVEGVFAPEECDRAMDGIVSAFERLSPGLDRADPRTWTRDRLPPQTRVGLYQAVIGNLHEVWRLRVDPRVGRLFAAIYSALLGRAEDDFIVSGDGLNLKPNGVGPYGDTKDWAHLDQTRGSPYRCVQGQVVLTNTTASLRASPRSHLAFERIVASTGGPTADDWRKFTPAQVATARALTEGAGGEWQVPIRASKGAAIFWTSSTVHSAAYQVAPEPPDPADPWRGWRGVVYVCYRPRAEFTPAQLARRRAALEGNRVMNHWSTRTFPANPNARYGPPPAALTLPDGRNLVATPAAVYDLLGAPRLAPGRERRLAGHDDPLTPLEQDAPEAAAAPRLGDGELEELLAGLGL